MATVTTSKYIEEQREKLKKEREEREEQDRNLIRLTPHLSPAERLKLKRTRKDYLCNHNNTIQLKSTCDECKKLPKVIKPIKPIKPKIIKPVRIAKNNGLGHYQAPW